MRTHERIFFGDGSSVNYGGFNATHFLGISEEGGMQLEVAENKGIECFTLSSL